MPGQQLKLDPPFFPMAREVVAQAAVVYHGSSRTFGTLHFLERRRSVEWQWNILSLFAPTPKALVLDMTD